MKKKAEIIKKKEVYGYIRETGEFYGIEYANLCPVTKKDWHYPACTTDVAPPEEKEGFVRIFNTETNEWSYIEGQSQKENIEEEIPEKKSDLHRKVDDLTSKIDALEIEIKKLKGEEK